MTRHSSGPVRGRVRPAEHSLVAFIDERQSAAAASSLSAGYSSTSPLSHHERTAQGEKAHVVSRSKQDCWSRRCGSGRPWHLSVFREAIRSRVHRWRVRSGVSSRVLAANGEHGLPRSVAAHCADSDRSLSDGLGRGLEAGARQVMGPGLSAPQPVDIRDTDLPADRWVNPVHFGDARPRLPGGHR